MTLRSACLLAAAFVATPALAQGYDPGPPPPLPEIDESWDEYREADSYDERPDWEHRERHSDAHDARPGAWREHPMPARVYEAYPPDQRHAWLEECRARYVDASGRQRGEVIGGVLGAVAGGIAGNRIADGERLGGTLLGAGVGGLAGAAIGGAIGGESDRDRAARGYDECESYLVRHEQGYRSYGHHASGAVGYHYPYPYPVMWVKVPIHSVRRGDCGCETVVEEWVEEEEVAAPPARREKRVKIRRIAEPAPAPGKRIRTRK